MQFLNAHDCIEIRLAGTVISARAVQPINAPLPIIVTPDESLTFVRFAHPENAVACIVLTLLGILTVFIALFLKASFPISVTGAPPKTSGITTAFDAPV